MSIEESISDPLDAQRTSAELRHHTRRLGVSWSAVAVCLMAAHAEEFAAAFGTEFAALPGNPVLSFDPAAMLALLRTLPDGAGDQALVQAITRT